MIRAIMGGKTTMELLNVDFNQLIIAAIKIKK